MKSSFVSRISATVRATAVATFVGLAAVTGVTGASVVLASPGVAAPAIDPTAPGMVGDPAKAAQYWAPQSYDDDCVLMSVADVVGQITGQKPSEQDVITLAENTPSTVNDGPVYTRPTPTSNPDDGGTSSSDIAVLLAHYGIQVTTPDAKGDAALDALKTALAQRHAVLIGVDSGALWYGTPPAGAEGDHQLVVTGVDTVQNVVHLNDPGDDEGGNVQVPLAQFMEAWKGSSYEMTVTQETVK
jgi:hypothetical protein